MSLCRLGWVCAFNRNSIRPDVLIYVPRWAVLIGCCWLSGLHRESYPRPHLACCCAIVFYWNTVYTLTHFKCLSMAVLVLQWRSWACPTELKIFTLWPLGKNPLTLDTDQTTWDCSSSNPRQYVCNTDYFYMYRLELKHHNCETPFTGRPSIIGETKIWKKNCASYNQNFGTFQRDVLERF